MTAKSQPNWRQRFRRFFRIVLWGSVGGFALVSTVLFIFLISLNRELPSIDSLKNYEPKEVSLVFSRDDELIGEFFEERRRVIHEFPEWVKNAFLAAEDSNFYRHQGVDFMGILRAAYINFKAGSIRQGASTITQQVARAFLLSNERTYARKLKEAILAWRIEQELSKDQILHLYLNHVYLGHGAYGVAAAAEIYFGKKVNELTIAEAAILGGLPQLPSVYSPARNPDRVKRRQLYVLGQMERGKFISQEDYEVAANEDVYVQPRRDMNRSIAPYFTEFVRQYVMKKYGSRMVLQDGLRIFTTLDVEKNRYAQNALRKGLSDLEKRQGYRGPLRRLSREEMETYFEGREFAERDATGLKQDQDREVSAAETEGRGKILMRLRSGFDLGEVLEGLVTTVDDQNQRVIVEYEPSLFAKIDFADMQWATQRVDPDSENPNIAAVRKPSDVLRVGDVIVMSVKELNIPTIEGVPQSESFPMISALLEQDTEVEGAILSVDPSNGYMVAMIGGYDFNRSEFNRAIQARRQPGSAFKPIVYAAALDLGFTPATVLQDSPITFENQLDEEKWRPNNYDRRFVGDTTLRDSLLASRNITTIKILNEIGLDRVVQYARRLGIRSELTRDFTLALGSSVVTLDDILRPYIVFATGGYPRELVSIRRIEDRYGNILEENIFENFESSSLDLIDSSVEELRKEMAAQVLSEPIELEDEESASFLSEAATAKRRIRSEPMPTRPGQVLSAETSFLMTHLLKENILYGSGRRARNLQHPASGKTGTTDSNRDAWFIGYTAQLVTGVWVGYDDLRRLGRFETGGRAAVPIWAEYMINASENLPRVDFVAPENIEFARINPRTGELADAATQGAVFEAFVKGTAPTAETRRAPQQQLNLYQRD
jgi:penicillin-binding protein 1A